MVRELASEQGAARVVTANVMHSAATDDHGTPRELVEAARRVLGEIELDPFSSSYWNHYVVKAARFYDVDHDGFAPEQAFYGRMLINPPGSLKRGDRNVPRAWEKLITAYRAGAVDSCVWIGFSLEQLVQLQNCAMHPLQFLTAVPMARLCFLQHASGGGPPIEGESPTHGNYVTLLPCRRAPALAQHQMLAFEAAFSAIGGIGGAIVRPL